MSMFNRRNVAIGLGVGAVAAYFFPRSFRDAAPVGNAFETPASKSIGNRYSSGGGSDTHLPGAATPRGNENDTLSPQHHPKGIDTPAFTKGHGDQKASEDTWPESFNKAQYGPQNPKGK